MSTTLELGASLLATLEAIRECGEWAWNVFQQSKVNKMLISCSHESSHHGSVCGKTDEYVIDLCDECFLELEALIAAIKTASASFTINLPGADTSNRVKS